MSLHYNRPQSQYYTLLRNNQNTEQTLFSYFFFFFFIENKNSQCFDVSEVKKCLAYILFVYKFELISPQGEVEKQNRNGQAPQSDEQYKEQEFPIQQNTNWLCYLTKQIIMAEAISQDETSVQKSDFKYRWFIN